jgi:hypothetical protein
MIPFMWSAGAIFGAAMGGYLSRPAETWPIFKGTLFEKLPYLLPNAVAAAYIVFAISIGVVLLKETYIPDKPHLVAKLNESDERTPFLDPNTMHSNENERQAKERQTSITTMAPVTAGTTIDIRRLSISTGADSVRIPVTAPDSDAVFEDDVCEDEPPSKHGYSRAMILLIAQLFLMSYHQMGFGALTPIFLLDEPSKDLRENHGLDLRGGLGYSLHDVGQFLAINGVIALVLQLVAVPPFVRRMGIWESVVWMTALSPLVYVLVPFLTTVPRPQLPHAIYAALTLQLFTSLIVYPSLLIALKNATPTMSMLGQVNGIAMAGCSGARTLAPPLAGYFYGEGGQAAGWWSVGAVALMAAILLIFMKPPQQTLQEEA